MKKLKINPKRKLKNYLRIVPILFGILLLLWNCQSPEISDHNLNQQQSDIKISVINNNQLKENVKIIEKLEKIQNNKSKLNAKGIYIETYDFTVNTDYVKYIEKDNLKSYTFPISRNSKSNDHIENLVLSSNDSGDYDAVIIDYGVSIEQLKTITKEQLDSTIVTYTPIDVDYNTIIKNTKNSSASKDILYMCTETWELVGFVSPRDFETVDYVWVLVSTDCSSSGGGGGSFNTTNPDGQTFYGTITSGGGSGTIISSPTYSIYSELEEAKYNTLSRELHLNIKQFDWLYKNDYEAMQLYDFLKVNNFSSEYKNFATKLINYLIDNPSMNWDVVINNRTSFDANGGEVDNYADGGYDTTTYPIFYPQQQSWPQISSVIPQSKFIGWNRLSHPYWECMDYATEQLRVMGYQISSYNSPGQTFQIYTSQDGVKNTALLDGLSYLKYALINRIPVIVGVDVHSGSPNPQTDNTTDHFIVIVGMGSDAKGNYFQFYDNASGIVSQGANPNNKLYYNSINGKITGVSQTSYAQQPGNYNYILTMIRKSKPN